MSEAEVKKLEEILEDDAKVRQWREQRHQGQERLRIRGACVNVLLASVVFILLLVLWFWIAGRI
jgi:ABC-type lipoprotein release transport system permease subunit